LVVKSYEGLNREVLRRKEARQYRLWLLLRSQDLEGKGWVRYEEAQEAFLRLGLSRRSFRDTLRRGEGVWWKRVRLRDLTQIRYTGLRRLCETFRTLPGRPVLIPLPRKLSEFKSLLYASFFTKPKVISRTRLQELTGRSKTTLRRWEKSLEGLRIQHNLGYSEDPQVGIAWQLKRVTLDGKSYWAWEIPNTYVAEVKRAPWGLARKVKKELRRALDGGEGNLRRLYFRNPRIALRYLRETGEPVYVWDGRTVPVPLGRDIRPFRLWSYVSS